MGKGQGGKGKKKVGQVGKRLGNGEKGRKMCDMLERKGAPKVGKVREWW